MSVLQLFITILVLLSLSIIFMLVNVIFQLKIGSRIGSLKRDLEKTNVEFLLLKKGRAAFVKPAKPAAETDMSASPGPPLSQETIEEGGIKIVRNVRGTFTEALVTPADQVVPDGRQVSGAEEYPGAAPPRESGTDPFISMYDIDETKRWVRSGAIPPFPFQTPHAGGTPGQRQLHQAPAIAIPLYSPAAQGPDFNALYATLVKILATPPEGTIAFDFAGIQFLHDQELDYLETLYGTLLQQDRVLIFINCGDQVSVLLRHRPQLAGLIR